MGEASGTSVGNVVRLNLCTGGPTQRWHRLPNGQGMEMIQLQGTDQCLDVVDKEGSLNGASVELRVCSKRATESWMFESPLAHGIAHYLPFLSYLPHLKFFLITAVAVGTLVLGGCLRPLQKEKRAM